MKRIPEGARRVCVVLGTMFVLVWLTWATVESDGFSQMESKGWGMLVVVSCVAYFAPFLIYRVIAWVREGFSSST